MSEVDVRLPQHGRDHRPGGSDPIPGLGGPRFVYGSIQNDGVTDDEGSGDWEVSWDSANGYTFTVDPPFPDKIRNVQLTASCNNSAGVGGGVLPYFVVHDLTAAEIDTFVVYTFDADQNPADGSFSFEARETPA